VVDEIWVGEGVNESGSTVGGVVEVFPRQPTRKRSKMRRRTIRFIEVDSI
jgi:hypothetical protein